MRIQCICLALAIVLACPYASAQWVPTNGPQPFEVHALAVSGSNLFALGCTDAYAPHYGVFRSTDNGTSWVAVDEGLPDTRFDAIAVTPDIGGRTTLFAGSIWGQGIFASTNNGGSWGAVNKGLPYDSNSHSYSSVNCLFTTGSSVFAGTISGMFRSTNGGVSWTATSGMNVPVWDFAANDGYLFCGVGDPMYDSSTIGAYRSTDDGTSWTKLSISHTPRFAVCGPYLFAQHWGGLKSTPSTYRSSDNGTTWSLTDSLGWYGVFAVVGTSLFYGNTSCGGCPIVVVSHDYATSWAEVDSGFPYLYNVTTFASNGVYLFAGTYSGVWRRPLSEMITNVHLPSTEVPSQLALHQNYPNPFNPSTTIKYELPKSSIVRLSVYDMLGRQVSVLVNEKKDAGVHEVKFDGSNLSSGVYFYRIQAGDFVQSKKLVVLK